MQYPDIGNQYRSEIFFVDQDQNFSRNENERNEFNFQR